LAKINILNRILPGKLGVCILAKRDPPSNACQLYGNPKFRTTIKSHMVYGSSKWTWAKQMKNAINQHAWAILRSTRRIWLPILNCM